MLFIKLENWIKNIISIFKQDFGGLRYEYRESDSRTMGEKIDRDFGFDINIAITG